MDRRDLHRDQRRGRHRAAGPGIRRALAALILAWLSASATAADEEATPHDRALALRTEAKHLRDEGRMDEALARLDAGMALISPADDAWPWLAVLAADTSHWLGRPGRTYELLEQLADETPEDAYFDGVRLTAAGIRGLQALDQGRHAEAEAHFEEELRVAGRLSGISRTRGLQRAHLHKLHLGLMRNEHDDVVRTILELLRDEVLYPEGSEARATLLHNQALATGQLVEQGLASASEVEALLWAVEACAPSVVLARQNAARMVRLLLDAGRFDEVPRWLERLDPDDAETATLASRHGRLTAAGLAAMDGHRTRLVARLGELERRWSEERVGASGRGLLAERATRALVDELVTLDLLVDPDGWTALQRAADLSAASSLARDLGLHAPDVRALAAGLEHGRGLLVFLPTVSGGSHVFALERSGVTSGRVASYHTVEPHRARWVAQLGSGQWSRAEDADRRALEQAANESARVVSRELLPPAVGARVEAWSQVTVVGLDGVGPLPFAWLPLGDGRPLGLDRAVDRWPGLAVGAGLAAVRDPVAADADLDVALLAAPVAGPAVLARWPGLPPLELGPRAAAELLDAHAPERVQILRADAAGVSGLQAVLRRSPRVLQILAHGVQDWRRERPGLLVLSPATSGAVDEPGADGLLDSDLVDDLAAPALVMLMGCRTGLGPERRGDARSAELTGAFVRAGARAVLVSATELSWGAALDASQRVHTALRRDGLSPAEALRLERVALFEAHGLGAPFAGGLLAVSGAGQLPVFAARAQERRRTLGAVVTLVVLAGGAAWWFTRRRRSTR